MNYLDLVFWGITALFLLAGIIMGAVRGGRRSVLRLVLVLVCVVAAYFLRKPLADVALKIKVNGVPMQEWLMNMFQKMFGSDLQNLSATVEGIVRALCSVLIFVVTFFGLKFITWAIVYPLCKLIVKKGKKKHAFLGAFVGLLQGAAIALCICVPLAGMVSQVNKLMGAVSDMQEMTATVPSDGYYAALDDGDMEIIDGEDETEEPDKEDPSTGSGEENGEGGNVEGGGATEGGEGAEGGNSEGGEESGSSDGGKFLAVLQKLMDQLKSFDKSVIGKFYTKPFKKPFQWISTVKVEQTNKETGKQEKVSRSLDDQVEAIVDAVKGASRMIKDLAELKNIEWGEDIDKSVAEQIQAVLIELDKTKSSIKNEDSIKIINEVADLAIKKLELPVNAENFEFDLDSIKFADEGALIVNVVDVANKEEFTSDDLKTITDNLSNSTFVMPILEKVTSPMTLPEEKKAMVELAFQDPEIDNPEKYDQDVLETLRFVFGLSNGNGPDVPPPPQTPEISE